MKILAIFGSASDEAVSAPLVKEISEIFETEHEVLSAHRDPEKLRAKISGWRGDAIVAGAGLAAALPGVVAAMTPLPVFGVPVPSQFGGIDSLGAIAQMPPGVPVMACGTVSAKPVVAFLKHYKVWKDKASRDIHFVVAAPSTEITAEIEKAETLAAEKGIAVTTSSRNSDKGFNVVVVAKTGDIRPDDFCLHIPFISQRELSKPEKYLAVMDWMNRGGLWVGVNNLRNAVLSLHRLTGGGQSLPEILYEGSVKNVRGTANKSPYIFEYSDRYSIFDWGEMPDLLGGKGKSLAFMGWFFFDFLGNPRNWRNWKAPAAFEGTPLLSRLREQGVLHHSIGLVSDSLSPLPLTGEVLSPTRCLAVRHVRVLHPEGKTKNSKLTWDYSAYRQKPENALVPLEVIFRFGVPEGSSLLKRTSDASYCRDLGLDSSPKTGDSFGMPVIEYSTKLENTDRYLGYDEAKDIAGLSTEEFDGLTTLTRLLALRLKDCFAGIDVDLWDGKFEFAFCGRDQAGRRGFMLVDSIGPDELRLMSGGVHLSKEILRSHYRPTAWHAGLEEAKERATERGERDWKSICTDELHLTPAPLPAVLMERAGMIYKGLAKALSYQYCDHVIFPEAWDLRDVVESFNSGMPEKQEGA
ncbi:MAG: phosphoribosylaminoimidazolesuccinocarboxamide synthase [Pseudomonadota bacterium]